MNIFNLPDLGEGLADAEIVQWHIKEGETISVDATLVTMETAKAIVDVPSPVSGTIKHLFGKAGDIIPTGAPLVEFVDAEVPASVRDTGTVAGKLETNNTVINRHATALVDKHASDQQHIKATPVVRALAKRLGVDLNSILASGPDNTIVSKDVESAAAAMQSQLPATDFVPLRGVRRAMAQTMIKSHAEVVPVTIVEDAILHNYAEQTNITIRTILALVTACKVEPALNAWFDGQNLTRSLRTQLDLGLAIDSDEGLFAPVIRDVANKDAAQLRTEIDLLKKQVIERSLDPNSLRGASFVLSNFGVFAGRYSNPIITPPCVAILGIGKLRDTLLPVNDQPKLLKVLPLSLSFDHRACTGGEAARFLFALQQELEKQST